jgi:hypothetical protein
LCSAFGYTALGLAEEKTNGGRTFVKPNGSNHGEGEK